MCCYKVYRFGKLIQPKDVAKKVIKKGRLVGYPSKKDMELKNFNLRVEDMILNNIYNKHFKRSKNPLFLEKTPKMFRLETIITQLDPKFFSIKKYFYNIKILASYPIIKYYVAAIILFLFKKKI